MGLPKITGNYPSTIWTEVSEAGQGDRTAALNAFGRIVEKYHTPLLEHLQHRFGLQKEPAEDLLQEFMSAKMVEQNLLARASRERGKFRTFLMTSLDRFAISQFRKQRANKRFPDGGFCSLEELPEAALMRLTQEFDESWAREVLNRTIELMKTECVRLERPDLWRIFEGRLLLPTLEGCEPRSCKELAAEFGLRSESQVSRKCSAAQVMYRQLLEKVVAEYACGPELVKEELAQLRSGLLK